MEQQEYLNRIHSEILTVMDEVHRICTENNLRYYLIGGTLLGAVRHKGFIPWDDDLDIVMPREDLEKLIEIASGSLAPDFQLEWFTTNKNYYQYFPKISHKGTEFIQDGIKEESQSGIFVDIFPIDLSPAYSEWLEKKKRKIRQYSSCITSTNSVKRSIRNTCFRLLRKILGVDRLFTLMYQEINSVSLAGKTHYANFGSQYSIKKQTMPIEWFGEGIQLRFENRYYYAPKEFINVIKSIFGETYMQLPPENKRRCHYPTKVVFSDGTEVNFKQPATRIKVTEQESGL